MEEIWKDVVGYEGYYQVSSLGRIRSVDREIIDKNGVKKSIHGKIMRHTFHPDGYPAISLCRNGVYRRLKIHRLVALAFIPNPNNLPEVSHLDETRTNNCVDNLVWSSHKDNLNMPLYKERSARATSKSKNGRAIPVECEGAVFETGTECAKFYGIKQNTMLHWLVCPEKMPTKWKEKGLKRL